MLLEIKQARKLEFYLTHSSERISSIAGLYVSGLLIFSPEFMLAFARFDKTDPENARLYSLFFYAVQSHIEQAFQQPVPPWLSRGMADFLATTYPLGKERYPLGAPDPRRPIETPITKTDLARALHYNATPKARASFERFAEVAPQIVRALLFEPGYAGSIKHMAAAYTAGVPMEVAAQELGDLATLQNIINKSVRAKKPQIRVITLTPMPPNGITLRPMAEDEIALIDYRFRRHYSKHREPNSRQLRALTDRFGNSALVWYVYAANEFALVQNSEFGGGPVFRGFGFANGELLVVANPYSDAEARRAVNRALALDPQMPAAQRLRAEILLDRLVRAGDLDDDGFAEVRRLLAPWVQHPETHPLAAALYHQAYIEQDVPPPDQALAHLAAAFAANAVADDLRYAYAAALSRADRGDEARRLLASMLNNPRFADASHRALDTAR